MEVSQLNIVDTIITTLNTLFENLFSSIDTNIYSLLDDIVFIDNNILKSSFLEKLLGGNSNSNLLIIANSLLVGFFIYYCFRLLFSNFYYLEIEPPYQFLLKFLVFSVCVNFSYFICDKIIYLNYLISASFRTIGESILNKNISFAELINQVNSFIVTEESTFNFFSFDGILKSFTSINLLTLTFSFALRYIMIKVFILITPFAILTLCNKSSSWFFKSWSRTLFSLLIIQSFVSIILIVMFSLDFSNNLLSKILFIGTLFALTKVNAYTRELLGGISLNVSANFSSLTKPK